MGEFRGVELGGLSLTGPRLTLRPWRDADAADVERAMQAAGLRRWFALPETYTVADALSFITRSGQGRADGGVLGCAMVENATGRVVGSAEVRLPSDADVVPSIGYWVAEQARGRGFAAEATRVLSEWCFARGIPRVELEMNVVNVASVRTALAAGFTFDGIRRSAIERQGLLQDVATFGRLATDPDRPVAPALPPLPLGGLPGEGIVLRIVEAEDALTLHEQECDPVTVATGFTGVAPSLAKVAGMAARAHLEFLVGQGAMFAIVDSESGALAGSIRLRYAGPPQIGGIGYAVHPAFRGRGITARALKVLATWAFGQCDFARLELGAKRSNVASQRAALAGGFEPDGVRATRLRNADGSFGDEVRFVLLNPAYC